MCECSGGLGRRGVKGGGEVRDIICGQNGRPEERQKGAGQRKGDRRR